MPRDYAVYVVIPAMLHIRPDVFLDYSKPIQNKTMMMLQKYISAGWGGNPLMVQRE